MRKNQGKVNGGIIKRHMTAKWEIVQAAQYADKHFPNEQIPDKALCDIYRGGAVPCILTGFISSSQHWGVTIVTRARDNNGSVHTHEMYWKTDVPCTFTDFIKGHADIKVDIGGFKVRWNGVSAQWLKTVDEDLSDMDVIDAWATANCLAEIDQRGFKTQRTLNQFVEKLAVMNKHASELTPEFLEHTPSGIYGRLEGAIKTQSTGSEL